MIRPAGDVIEGDRSLENMILWMYEEKIKEEYIVEALCASSDHLGSGQWTMCVCVNAMRFRCQNAEGIPFLEKLLAGRES